MYHLRPSCGKIYIPVASSVRCPVHFLVNQWYAPWSGTHCSFILLERNSLETKWLSHNEGYSNTWTIILTRWQHPIFTECSFFKWQLCNPRVQHSAIKFWKVKSPLPNLIVLIGFKSLNLLILQSNSVIATVWQVGRASNCKLFNSWSLYSLSPQVYICGGMNVYFPFLSLLFFFFNKPWVKLKIHCNCSKVSINP